MKYKIIFSYDGTNFYGFQKQDGYRTVEDEINKALTFMNQKEKTYIIGSGRTDKGVHAKRQVGHFEFNIDIPLFKIKMGLNSMLPPDIHIIDVCKVEKDFHARYMVKEKKYSYYINTGEYNPIDRNFCFQLCKKLNVDLMNECLKVFIGKHDFRSFISGEDKREDSVREIYSINIDKNNDIIKITFIGDGFMKYQIRNIVGSLVEVGLSKKTVDDVKKIMDKKDRNQAGFMVPACGLFLENVKY